MTAAARLALEGLALAAILAFIWVMAELTLVAQAVTP